MNHIEKYPQTGLASGVAADAITVLPDVDPTFVGRARELGKFHELLDAAVSGRRQVLLLSGEPGIGKTRCADVFARIAEDCGALALWGRCHEEPGAPPYWPWVQVLREYIQSSSESELRLLTTAQAQDIAAIVPGLEVLAAHGDARPPPDPVTSDHLRFRTFDAIAQFLISAAGRVPLVLILDNLHWADAPSLSLLEFLCQELARSRVLIIGTYRDVEVSRKGPLLSTLGELSRETAVERIRLTGLPQSSIADLAERVLGIALQRPAVDAIYQQTDGNPLFVLELLKVLQKEGADGGATPIGIRIPDSVRETIGRRLSYLPQACNELLTVASVLGRYFATTDLSTVAQCEFKLVLASLEAATRAGLIEAAGAGADGYRFTHALIREVLYDELPALERLKLHGRAGDALVDINRADLMPVLSGIAHHYYEAAPLGYSEQAVIFGLRAAERATQMCAYEDAIAHYDRVLATLTLQVHEGDVRVVRVYFRKGCAYTLLGDTTLATEALLQGVKQAVNLRSPLLVDVITHLMWATSYGPQSHLVPVLERTLAALPEGDSVVRAKALAALANALRSTGAQTRIEPLTMKAVAMAERLSDADALCACIKLSIMALRVDPRSLQVRLSLGTQYLEAARRGGDDEALSDAYSWQVLHLLEAARPDELERLLSEYRQVSVARFGIHQYYVRSAEVTLALLRGDWQHAEKNSETLLAAGIKMRRPDAEGVYSAQMFVLNRDLGRLRALQPMVSEFIRNGAATAWIPGLMLVCAELGMLEDARRWFERVAEDDFRALPRDDMFVTCLVYCAETCARLADGERAPVLYSLLAPYAGGAANHPRAVSFGAADHYLGMLAVASGDNQRARTHFETALSVNKTMAAWPWLARTLFHYGTLLSNADESADQLRGRSLLGDAEQLAARLGMAALVEQIGSRPRGEGGRVFPDGLTAREIEVLQLLALGRSNKDISMVLAISLNTVATHVRSILNKTNSANRTEAAAYAIQNDLRNIS